ncbi:hypothetical protein P9112_003434 [Eukaryota sp. TZLM1-RC]
MAHQVPSCASSALSVSLGESVETPMWFQTLLQLGSVEHVKYQLIPFAVSLFGNIGISGIKFLENFRSLIKERAGKELNFNFWHNRIVFSILKAIPEMLTKALLQLGIEYENRALKRFDDVDACIEDIEFYFFDVLLALKININDPFLHIVSESPHQTTNNCIANMDSIRFPSEAMLNTTFSSQLHIIDPPSDQKHGVSRIFSSAGHALLLTFSGEAYRWGCLGDDPFILNKPCKIPLKLPLNNIKCISTSIYHVLVLTTAGSVYSWGRYTLKQVKKPNLIVLPLRKLRIPFKIKSIYAGDELSLALTTEGQVIHWGKYQIYHTLPKLNNIIFVSRSVYTFVVIDNSLNFYFGLIRHNLTKINVIEHLTPKELSDSCLFLDDFLLFIIDINGCLWRCKFADSSDVKPTKVQGLTNIVFISGYYGVYGAVRDDGKVFAWGELNRISELYENSGEPICIEALTNVEGVSVGSHFIFAYNKTTVWAWGRNDEGQLGTGDLIDRPQPVKVFGSEILGSFHYQKQPLDRMFSGLIKLICRQYLNYLNDSISNHLYVKPKFYSKCGISKRVAQFAREVFNAHPIHNKMFLKNPQNLNLNETCCDLQLRFFGPYKGPKIINARIKELDVYYYGVDFDSQFFSQFPNVEVIILNGSATEHNILNFQHLPRLKFLKIGDYYRYFNAIIERLPLSLETLVLHSHIDISDISYLASLRECDVKVSSICDRVFLKGELPLPDSIVKLKIELLDPVNIEIQLPNLKEMIIQGTVPTNITEQNFPSLKFVQILKPSKEHLSHSPHCPINLFGDNVIKSVELIKNEYLLELSCFPWWIQYSTDKYLIEFYRIFRSSLSQHENHQ